MRLIKDCKLKSVLFFLILMISIIEGFFCYKTHKDYAGIYEIGIFLPLFFQPLFYYRVLYKPLNINRHLVTVILLLISLIIPTTIYSTLPSYTYLNGINLIEEYKGADDSLEFVYLSEDYDTIPVMNNPKRLFVSDRLYYYEVIISGESGYFTVNPITGEVFQLSNSYWRK